MGDLTRPQRYALYLLKEGWRFSPGVNHMGDPVPEDLSRGYIMRAHPPRPHVGPKPRVEQMTLHALMRRGLVRRTPGKFYVLETPRLSPRERVLFLLMTDWEIKRGPDFMDLPPPDLSRGPSLVLLPPPGYTGEPPAAIFQATIEVLLREGAVVAEGDGFVLPPLTGAARPAPPRRRRRRAQSSEEHPSVSR
jgi:hypothetical protein